jgi:CheY-like chemotaxis protein
MPHNANLTIPFDAPETLTADARESRPDLRVLIVDDNMPAADALAKLLNKIGMHASARYSGVEALATGALSSYDLFLLDIGMPGMDGYELVGHLRKRGITAPIVALTGYGLADDKTKAAEAGFTAHLTKPVGLEEIRALFRELTSA